MKPISSDTWMVYFCFGVALFGSIFVLLGRSEFCDIDGRCMQRIEEFHRLPLNSIGDTLAGFFGSLAFVAAVIAVLLQSRELRAQREQLANHTVEFQSLNENQELQRFETLFGQLFLNFSEIVPRLKSSISEDLKGREVFSEFKRKLSDRLQIHIYYKYPEKSLSEEVPYTYEDVREVYQKVWAPYESDIEPYLTFLHNYYRIMDENSHAKKYHFRLVRSVLSKEELYLIFYNCFSESGESFVKYVRKHKILDNIPDGWIPKQHLQLFEEYADKLFSERAWS